MKHMSLKTKGTILMLVITMIPLIILGGYSSVVVARNMSEQLYRSSLSVMQTTLKFYIDKNKQIEQVVRLIEGYECPNENSEYLLRSNYHLSGLHTGIKGLLVAEGNKIIYSENIDRSSVNMIRLNLIFPRQNKGNRIRWNTQETVIRQAGIEEDCILAKTQITWPGEKAHDIYFLLEENFFENILNDVDMSGFLCIVEDDASLIVSNDTDYYRSMLSLPIKTLSELFTGNSDIISTELKDEQVVIMRFRSPEEHLLLFEIYPRELFYQDVINILSLLAVLIVIIFAVIVLIDVVMIRKFTNFWSKLSTIMNNFNRKNLTTSLEAGNSKELDTVIGSFNQMICNINQIVEQVKKEEDIKNQSIIAALHYQISPHFLFNALSAIRITAIKEKNENTAESLRILSKFYKGYLENSDQEIRLSNEIDHLKYYIEIMKLRYDDAIEVLFDISPEALNCMIPSMTLQPIVENALVHGLAPNINSGEKKLQLVIRARAEEDRLMVSVEDNGTGIEQWKIDQLLADNTYLKKSNGIGISNIDCRIRTLYGPEYGISIESETGEHSYTIVRIELQAKTENSL